MSLDHLFNDPNLSTEYEQLTKSSPLALATPCGNCEAYEMHSYRCDDGCFAMMSFYDCSDVQTCLGLGLFLGFG